MKKINALVLAIVALPIVSCENQDLSAEAEISCQETYGEHLVEESEVMNEVYDVLSLIDNDQTRATRRQRTIESINYVPTTTALVRSECDSIDFAGLYVVNFSNDEGFAIASADYRTTPIFCVTEKGHFDVKSCSNPAMAIFLTNLEAALKNPYSGLYDIDCDSENTPTTRATYTYGSWQLTSSVSPKITTSWHELSPYNASFPLYSGTLPAGSNGHIPTGSSTIAVGQILAAMEMPNVAPVVYNWSLLKGSNASTSYIANYLRDIGSAIYSDWDAGLTEPECDIDDVKTYMENCGCNVIKESKADDHVADAVSFLSQSLSKNNIIYSRADASKKTILGIAISYSGEHAWAIDGCAVRERTVTKTKANGNTSTSTETQRLLHCVMGFGGNCDGYYVDTEFTAMVQIPTSPTYLDQGLNLVYRNKFLYVSK